MFWQRFRCRRKLQIFHRVVFQQFYVMGQIFKEHPDSTNLPRTGPGAVMTFPAEKIQKLIDIGEGNRRNQIMVYIGIVYLLKCNLFRNLSFILFDKSEERPQIHVVIIDRKSGAAFDCQHIEQKLPQHR